MKFPKNKTATKLIRQAEAAAVRAFENQNAEDPKIRDAVADAIKRSILVQVVIGLWDELGVRDPDQMVGLVVRVRLGTIHETKVVIDYDFTKTTLGSLLIARKHV